MKTEFYNFFFYTFPKNVSQSIRILSALPSLALATVTRSADSIAFRIAHGFERLSTKQIQYRQTQDATRFGFVGIEALIQKQQQHLPKLRKLAAEGQWQHLQTHTDHPDSGFDWWMFPVDRGSKGQGDLYKVNRSDIATLKKDSQFMKNYREGVILVAKSWGWNLETLESENNPAQYWSGYQVRLGKMLHSLQLFGQEDLRNALISFIDQHEIRPTLEPWIQNLLD